MLIDAHHHLLTEPGYADKLVAACHDLGIDRVCVFGAGPQNLPYGIADNDAVLAAMQAHPDRIIAFAYFMLGKDRPQLIDAFVARGFRGVKFIYPTRNYDDEAFYPVYERVEKHGIPAVFHLGIVARTPTDKEWDIHNDRHRPIYLDTLARAFPAMKLVGAHLGNPWYEEAAMVCRWNTNLYFDLSGSTLKCKSPQFLGDLLWWTPTTRYRDPLRRNAWEKIVFGSDVHAHEIHDVLTDYRRVMNHLSLAADVQNKILGGTMAALLGL
ncbi:MAG: hypothetical protein A3K19_06840 [Lentisphaerae bacterium RIFOXYB12_FULL_65_16]|nr:MAG: hypothetical protein A3K18_20030 [Lentisphaerae bacterium RIFOXYA12_64_32]OGV93166.1 MAG: hypothetical protein A3K19_06840 [Lentisphaerae bacterium RIFOXYB12_FULL_65_16]